MPTSIHFEEKKDRKRIISESLLVLGWFLVYYGAWNLFDILGFTDNIVLNSIFASSGFIIILVLVIFGNKSDG